MKKYITIEQKTSNEVEDLDFTLDEDFGYSNDNKLDIEKIDKHFKSVNWITYYIKISELEKEINKAKDLGANYINIYANEDHHSFIINSFNIYESTDDEIRQELDEENQAEIDYLIKQKEKFIKIIEDLDLRIKLKENEK